MANARIKSIEYDFSNLSIKGKSARGNQITKYPIKRVDLKEKGGSTLGGVKIWWDDMTGRLNGDAKGQFLGEFEGDDKVLVIYKDGHYELSNYELINRFEPDTVYFIQKYFAAQVIQVVYLEGKSKFQYVKRFLIETLTMGKKFPFIGEEKGSELLVASTSVAAQVELTTEKKSGEKVVEMLVLDEFMDVKGWKVLGNRLSQDKVKKVVLKSDKVGEAPVVTRRIVPVENEDLNDSDVSDDEGSEEKGSDNDGGSVNIVDSVSGSDSVKPKIENRDEDKGKDKPSNDGNVILGGDGSPQLNLL
jgi:topoisomerase-4 subunit A